MVLACESGGKPAARAALIALPAARRLAGWDGASVRPEISTAWGPDGWRRRGGLSRRRACWSVARSDGWLCAAGGALEEAPVRRLERAVEGCCLWGDQRSNRAAAPMAPAALCLWCFAALRRAAAGQHGLKRRGLSRLGGGEIVGWAGLMAAGGGTLGCGDFGVWGPPGFGVWVVLLRGRGTRPSVLRLGGARPGPPGGGPLLGVWK
ncbi:hypothetical protein NDU88_008829 [Pleurodeles waltl]|uniref:Uncharacterized protein n=1 Tax=Pleurodeles waltl TaxID=8319 RepID=A0AAV7RTK3_PLEWA|nr:hypothetical protein NDU88_008829 [Pleurodeles waltl]